MIENNVQDHTKHKCETSKDKKKILMTKKKKRIEYVKKMNQQIVKNVTKSENRILDGFINNKKNLSFPHLR